VGRKANLVKVIVGLLVYASLCAPMQVQPQRPGPRQMGPPSHRPPPGQSVRERWSALPPAERQAFQRNAERWMRMSPAERDLLRTRENLRREQIRREAEGALRQSGISLDPHRRDLFESRYMQERRKMERALRDQIETERQQQLPALIQQLKKEFQLERPLNASPLPRATESPKGE
jgi:hypothetical protein